MAGYFLDFDNGTGTINCSKLNKNTCYIISPQASHEDARGFRACEKYYWGERIMKQEIR